jgi:TRAP-type C4-dicarboxylate transport system permease small subunit
MTRPAGGTRPGLSRLGRGLNDLDDMITTVLLMIVTVIAAVAVVMRYVFNEPLTWSDEVNRMMFVWMIFIASAALLKTEGHLGFEMFTWRSRWVRMANRLVIEVSGLAFAVGLIWYGWKFVDIGRLSSAPATGLSYVWVYVALPVCGVLYFLRTAWRIAAVLRAGDDPLPQHSDEHAEARA